MRSDNNWQGCCELPPKVIEFRQRYLVEDPRNSSTITQQLLSLPRPVEPLSRAINSMLGSGYQLTNHLMCHLPRTLKPLPSSHRRQASCFLPLELTSESTPPSRGGESQPKGFHRYAPKGLESLARHPSGHDWWLEQIFHRPPTGAHWSTPGPGTVTQPRPADCRRHGHTALPRHSPPHLITHRRKGHMQQSTAPHDRTRKPSEHLVPLPDCGLKRAGRRKFP